MNCVDITPPASTCTCEEPKPERQGLIVDRGRRTTMAHCEGCSQKWDRPNGSDEFSFWAMGFTAGKRATMIQASETAEPEMGAWSILYGQPDDQHHEVMGESPIGGLVDKVTTQPVDDTSYTPPVTSVIESLVGWPEWFLPLMKLRGFTYGDHVAAIDIITNCCRYAGITPELVVANFVTYWMPRRQEARWECPVAGLWEDLDGQIALVVKASPVRRAAVLELTATWVGPEYGCRYCNEGGFRWAEDLGPGGSSARWPVVCDHTSRMSDMGRNGPPLEWQPRSWDVVLEALRQRLPAAVYTSWVMDLELLGFDGQVALVKCYNRVHGTWIYRHLIQTLRDALVGLLGDDYVDLEMMMVWGSDSDAAKTT